MIRIGTIKVVPFNKSIFVNKVYNELGRLIAREEMVFAGGFHVVAQVMDCGDGMFQEIEHPAVFKSLTEADAFMEILSKKRLSWNLNNWRVGNHPCNAWQCKPEDEPLFYGVHHPVPSF